MFVSSQGSDSTEDLIHRISSPQRDVYDEFFLKKLPWADNETTFVAVIELMIYPDLFQSEWNS